MDEVLLPEQRPQDAIVGKTFWIRAGAYVIDSVIYVALNFAVSFTVGIVIGILSVLFGVEPVFVESTTSQCAAQIIGLIQFTLFFIVFEWLFGASPGKYMLGMRVVAEDGMPCGLGKAVTRAVLRYIDGFFFGIPAYSSMKPPLHQRIGDKSAKTIVVSADDAFIKEPRPWWWFLIAMGLYLSINTGGTLLTVLLAAR